MSTSDLAVPGWLKSSRLTALSTGAGAGLAAAFVGAGAAIYLDGTTPKIA